MNRANFIDVRNDRLLLGYFRVLQNIFGVIRLTDLIGDEDVAYQNIESLFVEPAFSESHIQPETVTTYDAGMETLLNLLERYQHLVLLGDPGSGKSTLIGWLTSRFARISPNLFKTRLGNLIPLPFVLRELDIEKADRWENLVEQLCNKVELQAGTQSLLSSQLVHDLMQSGQCFVMFDGIDEVSSVQVRARLRQIMVQARSTYPLSRWLFTSRIVGYDECPFYSPRILDQQTNEFRGKVLDNYIDDQGRHVSEHLVREDFDDPQFGQFYVAPFDDARIDDYSRKWYGLREKEPSRSADLAQKFTMAIRSHGGLGDVVRIPILLAFLALIHLRDVILPNGRTEAYRRIAEIFLERIQLRKGLDASPYRLELKMRWISKLGLTMQARRVTDEEGALLLTSEELLATLTRVMRQDDPMLDNSAPAEFLSFVARRAGLFLPRGEGAYGFVHLSFQEFFAGWAIADIARSRKFDPDSMPIHRRAFRDLQNDADQANLWPETLPELLEQWSCMSLMRETLLHASCLLDEESSLLFARACVANFRPLTSERGSSAFGLATDLTIGPDSKIPFNLQGTLLSLASNARQSAEPTEGGSVSSDVLNLSHSNISDTTLAHISGFNNVHGLNLSHTKVTDCGIASLLGLAMMHTLNLSYTSVTDACLSNLARLSRLKDLNLSSTAITDVGLANLKPLKELQDLSLSNTTVTDKGIMGLTDHVALRSLWLWRTKVSNKGLASLAGLPKLHSLWLWDANVTNAGLALLAKFPSLEVLELCGTKVTDAGLASLSELAGLRGLNLWDTKVSDVGLARIAELSGLRALDLWNTVVTDAGIVSLASLTNLEHLNLTGTLVTDSGLASLAGLIGLRTLKLSATKITDSGLGYLAGLTDLETLDLGGTQITNSGLARLAELKELKTLRLSDTNVTDEGLANLSKLKKLQVLDLGSIEVTDEGISHLAGLTQLQSLTLRSDKLTNASVDSLFKVRSLKYLELARTSVTAIDIAELSSRLLRATRQSSLA